MIIAISWIYFFKNVGSIRILAFSFKKIADLMELSWPYWWNSIVSFLYGDFQTPLIAALIGSESAGVFRAAWATSYSLDLLFNAISALLILRLTKWKEMGESVLKSKQKLLVKVYLILGIHIVVILALSSDIIIFGLLFGVEFKESSGVFKILILSRLNIFVAQVYALSLFVVERDKHFALVSTIGSLLVSVTLNIIFLPIFGVYAAAVIVYVTDACVGGLFYYFYRRYLKANKIL